MFPLLPKSGLEYYDSVMREIEPDLTSINLRNLSKQYSNESEIETNKRSLRYYSSFNRFISLLAEKEMLTKGEIVIFFRRALDEMEALSRLSEKRRINELEHELST